jgi:hypothetical protein
MSRITRVRSAALALAFAAAATPAVAQIPGMPLFTNPRMATGIRVHADFGQPTDMPTGVDQTVLQGGLGLVIGPLGLDANVGTTKTTATAASGCIESPTISCADSRLTASLLAQLKIYGGGQRNLSVSIFGGGSVDFDTSDVSSGSVNPQNKLVTIPVGVAVGLRVPLPILSSLNLWAAPRYDLYRFANCSGACPPNPESSFGWAVGADMPLFRVLSIRAAYDNREVGGATLKSFGVGASFGFGGMR